MSNVAKYGIERYEAIKKYVPIKYHNQLKRFVHEYYFSPFFDKRNMHIKYQYGGTEKIIEYDKYKFRVDIEKDMIVVFEHNSDNNCAIIIIDREHHIAILHSMSNFDNCIMPSVPLNKKGSIMLKFVLHFINKHKDAMEINRIVLKDNAYKLCNHCNDTINLSDMYFLLNGDTWYGSYGFRPYIESKNIPNTYRTKEYESYSKIVKETLVKNIDIYNIIKNAIKKHHLKDIDLKTIKETIDIAKDKKLYVLLKALLKDYNKYCCLFRNILDDIFEKLNIRSFHGDVFYLDV